MQLLFNIDTDVNIQSKMTAIEQESLTLPEKFANKEIIEKGNDEINVVNENSITNTLDECTGNGNLKSKEHITSNSENISIENLDNTENQDSNKEAFNSSVELLSSSTKNVPIHSKDSNISSEIPKEEQNNVNHNINGDYESDKETNTNLKNDVIDLGSRVEKNETNIEIKVDIEVKTGSDENEQKINSTSLSENKENSDNNVDMKISTFSTSEGTPVTEETTILNSVKDGLHIEKHVEFDTRMDICDNNAEILYKENDKILEERIMDDPDEINRDNIVFNRKETIDENMSTEEIKSDIELCETESNLKLINPIKNKTEIDSILTSCEEVYSELQATSNSEQSPEINTKVQLVDDVIKIDDALHPKENKKDKIIDITDAIDDVNKENSLKGEISDVIGEVNKEIDEIYINTSNKLDENNVNKEIEGKELSEEEVTKVNKEIGEIDGKAEEDMTIQSEEPEINVFECTKVTSDEKEKVIEANEPDHVQEKDCSADQVVINVEEQAIDDKEKSSNFINDEIIDIADEIFECEEIPENSSNKLSSNETDIDNNDFECEKTKANKETENKNLDPKGKSGTETEDEKKTDIEKHMQNVDKTMPVEKKKLSHICKLSNTLDILSDEEEDSENVTSSSVKDCINIEDDDDIVLIDEGTSRDCKYVENDKIKESEEHNKLNLKENVAIDVCESKTDNIVELGIEDAQVSEKEIKVETELEKPMKKIPILPNTFLKTSKKSLAEMTRDELEEFCIKKIGESVIDRSNLNEIITQLKTVTTNIEEYKKRVNSLMKQNRDLQVIVKSVLEEQKNGSNTPITPLKITRSVGMQVFMTDKSNELMVAKSFQSFSPNKVRKRHSNQSLTATKLQTNSNQNIPVPRLVPAVNNTSSSSNKTSPATPTKIQGGPVPNGVWNSNKIQKPEKRPHSKVQNSVTVDLTDDEPPPKIIQRSVTPPVRLIPQQALLATQRPQFANNNNSPKKVYIPIGAAQNQVRPGHTIMLKQVSQGQRMRTPNILHKQSVASPLRVTRIAPRHPAPLPDSMKQYQPPNWKALPPTPELKLSKVDNGIVISWKINDYQEDDHEEIASYQLYAYQETSSPPSTALWKKIGDVKALPLPMACTLTQFMSGYKYYFAVRAVDIRSRLGPFSLPGSILLLNKM